MDSHVFQVFVTNFKDLEKMASVNNVNHTQDNKVMVDNVDLILVRI